MDGDGISPQPMNDLLLGTEERLFGRSVTFNPVVGHLRKVAYTSFQEAMKMSEMLEKSNGYRVYQLNDEGGLIHEHASDDYPKENNETENPIPMSTPTGSRKYAVLLGKPTTRKNKIWQDDGILTIDYTTGLMKLEVNDDVKQKSIAAAKFAGDILPGETEFKWDNTRVLITEEL